MSEYLYDTLFDDLIDDTVEETTNYNTYNTQEDNKMRLFDEVTIKQYVEDNTLEEALDQLHDETIEELDRYVDSLYGEELFGLVQAANDDLHEMEELDTVFRHMTPSEVLEQLCDIDLNDYYFNANTCCSGDDVWHISGISRDELIDYLYNQEIDWYDREYERIIEKNDDLKVAIKGYYKIYDMARELFEKALARNPQELINVLWNMNQQ